MKSVIALMAVSYLMAGCETVGSTIPHDDSIAAAPRSAGPTLCRDGTVPPCNPRGD